MLSSRFPQRHTAAFIVALSAMSLGVMPAGTDQTVNRVDQSIASLPLRAPAVAFARVRLERPSSVHREVANPAHRPLDATFLHDLAVSNDGTIWIAPLFNGFQWGGEYERVVRFDPSSNSSQSFKIARMRVEPGAIAPADSNSAWEVEGALVGRFSSDGALAQAVFSDGAEAPRFPAVDKAGDLWFAEPARVALGRVDLHSGVLSDIDLPPRIGLIAAVTLDGNSNVWFAAEHQRIGRYSPASHGLRVFRLPNSINHLTGVSAGYAGSVWFVDDIGNFGKLDASTGRVTVRALPQPATSVAAIGSGALVLVSGKLLSFEAANNRLVRLALPTGFSESEVIGDQRGGAWTSGQRGVAHLDPSSLAASLYPIAGTAQAEGNSPINLVAGNDGSVCFLAAGAADCLRSRVVQSIPMPAFLPGLTGIVSLNDRLWLAERGRLTGVDTATRIRRFIYLADHFGPADVAIAQDGAVWSAGHGLVERFSPSGVATAIQVGAAGSGPFGIAVDSKSRLWFAMDRAIGIADVRGGDHVIVYPLGSHSSPEAVAVDAHNVGWFTDTEGAILRVDDRGRMRRYQVPTPNAQPFAITIGPDSKVWFTEFLGNSIARLDPSTGSITEYSLQPPHNFPTSILAANGALWFLDLSGFLGRISTRGEITEISVPTPSPVTMSQ